MTDTGGSLDPHEVMRRADTLLDRHNFLIETLNKQLEDKDRVIEELRQSNEVLTHIALMKGNLQEGPPIEDKPTGVV